LALTEDVPVADDSPGEKDEAEGRKSRTVTPNARNIRWFAREPDKRGPRGRAKQAFMVEPEPPEGGEPSKDNPSEFRKFARELALSPHTARMLLDGKGVYPKTIQELAQKLDCSVVDIVNFSGVELPTDATHKNACNWYTNLNLSFYIDNNRLTTGLPSWYFERLDLKPDPGKPIVGMYSFTGTMRNQFDNVFDVKAFLMDRHLFTMLCTPRNERQLCFTASFTRKINLIGAGADKGETFEALEGTWSGIDHLGRNAVYRIFLTKPGAIACDAQPGLNSIRLHEIAKVDYTPDELPEKLESMKEGSTKRATPDGKQVSPSPKAGRPSKKTKR
jgi:DNA-binding Xre family transcriptional regulator